MSTDYDPIKLKRVYDKTEKSDGIRLLADRLWPRGIKKSELEYEDWIKALCPSTELRKEWHNNALSYAEFSKCYSKELDNQQPQLNKVASQLKNETVTLISAVTDLEKSHLPTLKKHLLEALEEISFGDTTERTSPVCYDGEE